jgi:Tfp pilus assembly protein PilV
MMLTATGESSNGRRGAGPARARRAGGFTLLEVVIALLVLMVIGLGATSLFLYSIRNNAVAAARSQALAVAQRQMEQFQSVAFDDTLLNTTSAAGTTPVTVTAGESKFQVSRVVTAQDSVTVNGVTRDTTKIITLNVTPIIENTPWAAGAVTLTARRSILVRGPY